jgi:hypothetical protein
MQVRAAYLGGRGSLHEWISGRFVLKQTLSASILPGDRIRIHAWFRHARPALDRLIVYVPCQTGLPDADRLRVLVSIDPAQEAAGAEVPYSMGGGRHSPEMSLPDSAD